MLIRKITESDYPAIVDIHNSLNIVWPKLPGDPESWLAADHNRDPKCHHQRWVAVEDGRVVGCASSGNRLDDYHPQKFYINIEVLDAYRCRGIGSSLFDQIMNALQPFEPRILRTDVLMNQIQGYPFVQKRGFKEVWRETPVHLDVKDFDPTPYSRLIEQLAEDGIQIQTLNDLQFYPDRDRLVYSLYMQLARDVPSELPEFIPSPFEDWSKWCLHDPSTDPNAFFIATNKDNFIALHDMGKDPSGKALLGGLLGTLPEYRGKKIGLALILRTIQFARENHIDTFRTCTAISNKPMQSLFDKLGFTRDPQWLQCEKVIRE